MGDAGSGEAGFRDVEEEWLWRGVVSERGGGGGFRRDAGISTRDEMLHPVGGEWGLAGWNGQDRVR